MPKPFYELLEVAADASSDEIKRAFRREIAKYHPDKVQHLGKEFQEIAANKAAELTRPLLAQTAFVLHNLLQPEQIDAGGVGVDFDLKTARLFRRHLRAFDEPQPAQAASNRPTRTHVCSKSDAQSA